MGGDYGQVNLFKTRIMFVHLLLMEGKNTIFLLKDTLNQANNEGREDT